MPRKRYPPELEPFIRREFKEHTARQIVPMVKDEFGINMTPDQVHNYVARHGIRGGRTGKKMPERRVTTPEIDEFIHSNHAGTGPTEMADIVNARFGTAYTPSQMKAYYARNKLKSGLDGRFKKGNVPVNKGKKWDEYMSPEGQEKSRRTQFRKGGVPPNGGAGIGEMRIRRYNRAGGHQYYWQKMAHPSTWRMKHIVEWEAHYGPVPDGYVISFADGDTLNWHIDNLVLTTKKQMAIRNKLRLKPYDRESMKTANLIADFMIAKSNTKKAKKEENRI